MNLPSGNIAKQGVSLKETDLRKEIKDLSDKNFSGYIAVTLEGFDGVEEGILLFKKGFGVAAIYEYTKYGVTVLGDFALAQFFNGSASSYAVMDVIELTSSQIDMSIAFNEKIKISVPMNAKAVEKLYKKKFEDKYAKNTLEQALSKYKKESKEDLFKKFGLAELEQ